MSDVPGNSNGIPNKVVDLLVGEIFRKNGVNINSVKKKLSDEQRTAIKELVEELSTQVDAFVKQPKEDEK